MAYELYLHLPRQLGTSPLAPRLHNLTALRSVPSRWGYLDEAQLTQFAYLLAIAAEFSEGTWHLDQPVPKRQQTRRYKQSG